MQIGSYNFHGFHEILLVYYPKKYYARQKLYCKTIDVIYFLNYLFKTDST